MKRGEGLRDVVVLLSFKQSLFLLKKRNLANIYWENNGEKAGCCWPLQRESLSGCCRSWGTEVETEVGGSSSHGVFVSGHVCYWAWVHICCASKTSLIRTGPALRVCINSHVAILLSNFTSTLHECVTSQGIADCMVCSVGGALWSEALAQI